MDVGTSVAVIAGIAAAGRPGAELAKDFIGRVFGPTADAIGATVAHPFVEFNKRRAARGHQMLLGAAHILEDRGRTPHQVPDVLLIPILNEGSLIDDADLQVVWAQLLASAASGEPACAVMPAFPHILSQLTAGEAGFLKYLYERADSQHRMDYSVDRLMKDYDPTLKGWEFYLILDNIARLRLIELHPQISGRALSEALGTLQRGYDAEEAGLTIEPGVNDYLFLTNLGDSFMKACTGPKPGAAP